MRQYASRCATSPVRSTRTPCQQIQARTNSRGRYAYARPSTYTYTPPVVYTSTSFVRENGTETRSTHTTLLTNPRASRTGEFLLRHRTAPSRNLAYARLSSPATAVSSTRSTLHCRATLHRDVGSNSDSPMHTRPNERTNARLTCAPSFNRTNHRADDDRIEPSPSPVRNRARSTTHNFP